MDAAAELILDALYDRQPGDRKSCFVVNRAGLALLSGPAERFVPSIEQVLREIVAPAFSGIGTQARQFRGLDYVLGAYMVLGVKLDAQRTVEFLATLPSPLLAEAVKNIPVFFAPEGRGYNPGILLGDRLQEFVQGLSRSESDDVRTAATRVIEWMIENGRL